MMLDEVAAYLVSSTTLTMGGTSGSLSKAVMLDTEPDTVVTLYETGGVTPGRQFSTGGATRVFEAPSLQALSRAPTYQVARARAQIVFAALDGLSNTTLSGTRYLDITADQSPFSIGRDANGRHLVSCNYSVRRSP